MLSFDRWPKLSQISPCKYCSNQDVCKSLRYDVYRWRPFGRARKDTILPLSKPIVGLDGKEIMQIMVPKGTNIVMSLLGSNTNPSLWGEDAAEWKPERWLSQLPEAVLEAHMPGIYSHLWVSRSTDLALCWFLTDLGWRSWQGVELACLWFDTSLWHIAHDLLSSGFKFSQLEMSKSFINYSPKYTRSIWWAEVVLAVLLSTFKFEPSKVHKITWKMTTVAGPYVEDLDRKRPRMPLIMTLVDS